MEKIKKFEFKIFTENSVKNEDTEYIISSKRLSIALKEFGEVLEELTNK